TGRGRLVWPAPAPLRRRRQGRVAPRWPRRHQRRRRLASSLEQPVGRIRSEPWLHGTAVLPRGELGRARLWITEATNSLTPQSMVVLRRAFELTIQANRANALAVHPRARSLACYGSRFEPTPVMLCPLIFPSGLCAVA